MSPRKKKPARPEYSVEVDKAAKEAFPELRFETAYNLFAMSHVTHYTRADGSKVTPAVDKQVKAFLKGFGAAAEVYY